MIPESRKVEVLHRFAVLPVEVDKILLCGFMQFTKKPGEIATPNIDEIPKGTGQCELLLS